MIVENYMNPLSSGVSDEALKVIVAHSNKKPEHHSVKLQNERQKYAFNQIMQLRAQKRFLEDEKKRNPEIDFDTTIQTLSQMSNVAFVELMFDVCDSQREEMEPPPSPSPVTSESSSETLQISDDVTTSRGGTPAPGDRPPKKKRFVNVNVGYTPETDPSTLSFKAPKSQSNEGGAFERQWNSRFEELKAFKEKFGHVNVTRVTKGYENLGVWLADQRKRFRAGKMTRQRFDLLTALGVEWDRSYYFKPSSSNHNNQNHNSHTTAT